MLELLGRLTVLDPEAHEGLKVISYFDALIEGNASFEILLRGAAILSGCAAGFASTNQGVVAVDSRGTRISEISAPEIGTWRERVVPGEGRVWIERVGVPHVNDEMILERLALALQIALERSVPVHAERKAVEIVIDPSESLENRRRASSQLMLDPDEEYVVVAEPVHTAHIAGHSAVMATAAGTVRATICKLEAASEFSTRAGIGNPAVPIALDHSWECALLALRLSSPNAPIIHSTELGGLTLLAELPDESINRHPDLTMINRLIDENPRIVDTLYAIQATESLRAASVKVGLHHSTIQSKVTFLSERLGFDISSAAGRTRLSMALNLYWLSTNRF